MRAVAGGEGQWEWFIVNDFLVQQVPVEDALDFSSRWRVPCILLYRDESSARECSSASLQFISSSTQTTRLIVAWAFLQWRRGTTGAA
jgi:hypothetical protein